MSTPPEHAPTEPQPSVTAPATSTPPARSVRTGGGGGYDPVARIALVIIAAIMVIFLLLTFAGYKFHVTVDKDKAPKDHGPKVTKSHTPKP